MAGLDEFSLLVCVQSSDPSFWHDFSICGELFESFFDKPVVLHTRWAQKLNSSKSTLVYRILNMDFLRVRVCVCVCV